jgi:hypothetical protein
MQVDAIRARLTAHAFECLKHGILGQYRRGKGNKHIMQSVVLNKYTHGMELDPLMAPIMLEALKTGGTT